MAVASKDTNIFISESEVWQLIEEAVEGLDVEPYELYLDLEEIGDIGDLYNGNLSITTLRLVAEGLIMRWEMEREIVDSPNAVQCQSCSHYRPIKNHPNLGQCAADRQYGIAGNWATDWHVCGDYVLRPGATTGEVPPGREPMFGVIRRRDRYSYD